MRRPIIGITLDHERSRERYELSYAVVDSVVLAGGDPVLLPFHDEATLPTFIDGLLLSGGNDPDPAAWGEPWHPACNPVDPHREQHERRLALEARRRGVPTLGICFGMQVMNLIAGGTLAQHLPDVTGRNDHARGDLGWRRRHDVAIRPNSVLARACGVVGLSVNTSHHQAVARVGPGLDASAIAGDGVVEAIEDRRRQFWLGVQWHPERLAAEETRHLRIFEALVRASA